MSIPTQARSCCSPPARLSLGAAPDPRSIDGNTDAGPVARPSRERACVRQSATRIARDLLHLLIRPPQSDEDGQAARLEGIERRGIVLRQQIDTGKTAPRAAGITRLRLWRGIAPHPEGDLERVRPLAPAAPDATPLHTQQRDVIAAVRVAPVVRRLANHERAVVGAQRDLALQRG